MISDLPTSPRPAFLGAMLPHSIFPYQQQQHRKHPQEEQLSPTAAFRFLHDAAPYALPLEVVCGRTTKTRVAHDDSWEARAFEEDVAKYSSLWPPRSYSCKYCSKDFRSAQALGGHMNIHRRERAFENRSNAFSSVSLRPSANLAPTSQASGEGSNYLAAFDGCWIYLPDPTAQQLQVLHPSSASECSDYEQKTNPFACSLAFGLSAPISKSTTPSSVVTKGSLSFITSMNLTSMHEMGTPSNTIKSDTLSDSSPQLSDQQSSQMGRPEARVGMQGRYLKNSKHLQQQTVPIENDLPVLDLELRLGMGGL